VVSDISDITREIWHKKRTRKKQRRDHGNEGSQEEKKKNWCNEGTLIIGGFRL